MTETDFRKMALTLPEAVEAEHMGHPDFRVRGKVFASLGHPKLGWGVVKLLPKQQQLLVDEEMEVFVPANGAWGKKGMTCVLLKAADRSTVRRALFDAWRNTAPESLAREHTF